MTNINKNITITKEGNKNLYLRINKKIKIS